MGELSQFVNPIYYTVSPLSFKSHFNCNHDIIYSQYLGDSEQNLKALFKPAEDDFRTFGSVCTTRAL